MISATGTQAIPNEWIDFFAPNVGYVKQGFRDQVLEAMKKESEASRARLEERLETGGQKASLTEEQKQYLKERFDLKNMSWEDYQSLIDKLCEYGALAQEDKKYLLCEYSGLDMTRVDFSVPSCAGSLKSASVRNPITFASWKGDVLGWAKYLSSFQSWDADTQSWRKSGEAILFGKLRDILTAIFK